MIAALERLKSGQAVSSLPESVAAFGMIGGAKKMFMTHPPLEERIAALQASGAVS